MAGFQAVDLDSILDEFESEQNEAEKDNESSNASKSEVEDKHKENLFGPRHGLNLVCICWVYTIVNYMYQNLFCLCLEKIFCT